MLPAVAAATPELVVEGARCGCRCGRGCRRSADEAADEAAGESRRRAGVGALDADFVSGHNVFTEAFGVRAVGYVSPPPKPTPMRVADDAAAAPERASDPRLFPLALRLAAAGTRKTRAVAARDGSRVDEHAWVVAYLDKVGNVDVKEPMDLTHEDLETWLAYLTRAMRDPRRRPSPNPAPGQN